MFCFSHIILISHGDRQTLSYNLIENHWLCCTHHVVEDASLTAGCNSDLSQQMSIKWKIKGEIDPLRMKKSLNLACNYKKI